MSSHIQTCGPFQNLFTTRAVVLPLTEYSSVPPIGTLVLCVIRLNKICLKSNNNKKNSITSLMSVMCLCLVELRDSTDS